MEETTIRDIFKKLWDEGGLHDVPKGTGREFFDGKLKIQNEGESVLIAIFPYEKLEGNIKEPEEWDL